MQFMTRKHKCKSFSTFKFLLTNSSNVLTTQAVYFPIFQMAVFTRAPVQATCVFFDYKVPVTCNCQSYLDRYLVFPVQIGKVVNLQMISTILSYSSSLPSLLSTCSRTLDLFQRHIVKFFYIAFSKWQISRDVWFLQILLFSFILFYQISKYLVL